MFDIKKTKDVGFTSTLIHVELITYLCTPYRNKLPYARHYNPHFFLIFTPFFFFTEVYITERFIFTRNFVGSQNFRFIIESSFKSRSGYNGARTVI